MTVTRKAAWNAEATAAGGWSESLRWYAVAIREMKALTPGLDDYRPLALEANSIRNLREPTQPDVQRYGQLVAEMTPIVQGWADPKSLGYHAQVHDTFLPRAAWPTRDGDPVLWHECAHGSWFFLPWHRAYLLEFEAVARAHVVRCGGPDEWALPYWNSSDYRTTPEAASLPIPMRDPQLPDGVELPVEGGGVSADRTNSLHEPSRTGPEELGDAPSIKDWPDATSALHRHHYANAAETKFMISFGGGYLEALTDFHSADESGLLDYQPHGLGHTHTGGFMGAFSTAGLDPVFWMHHANIDRLWETYAHEMSMPDGSAGHGYPFGDGQPPAPGTLARAAFDSWSDREFSFLRPEGPPGVWTAPGVIDVEALGYGYDTIAKPQFNLLHGEPPGQDVDPFGVATGTVTPVSAASEVEIGAVTSVPLSGGETGEDGRELVGAESAWTVTFDGLRCHAPAVTSYAVYLGSDGDRDPDHLLGVLSLFGVFESSLDSNGNLGRSRVFDATEIVRNDPGLNPLDVRVTLVSQLSDRNVDAVGLVAERIGLEVSN